MKQRQMINLEIHLYATLARYLPADAKNKTCGLSLAEGSTVADGIKALGLPDKSVKLIFVNGLHADRNTILKDRDRVGLFPPVGGG